MGYFLIYIKNQPPAALGRGFLLCKTNNADLDIPSFN